MNKLKDNLAEIRFKKPLKVLGVDDSDVDRRLLESMLTVSGEYASFVQLAKSFAETLALVDEHKFDVIVLDLNLPDSKGIDTLKALDQKCPNIPIVINTGAFEEELGIEALNSGAQDFLVKGEYTANYLNKALHYAVERKRLQSELISANRRVVETQMQLIQSVKMEVVGQLASGVAHEVKNPLGTIEYGITFLKDHLAQKEISKDAQHALTSVLEAVERADIIITDLLNFSSIKKINREEAGLEQVVQKSLFFSKYELKKKRIHVKCKIPEDIPRLVFDANKIQQVLINLILNAVGAMEKGGNLKIEARYEELDENINNFEIGQKVIVLSLQDDGESITEENLAKVFDPFFTTKRAKGGVGLGLSVSKQIMDLHEGGLILRNLEKGVEALVYFKI